MTRYADDMVILCTSAQEAEQALKIVRQWMQQAKSAATPRKDMSSQSASNRKLLRFPRLSVQANPTK